MMDILDVPIRYYSSTQLLSEARPHPLPWRAEHYLPNHSMTGPNNAWATRLIDADGQEIVSGIDPRWGRYPDDPGTSPTADLILQAVNCSQVVI